MYRNNLSATRLSNTCRYKPPPAHHKQSGNIFFALFGAIALVGVLGTVTVSVMRGPLSTMVEVQSRTQAESEMAIASRLALLEATELSSNGDCDGDGFVEPLEYMDASGAGPTGGGFLPNEVASSRVDPWGTQYGYCAWDAGGVTNNIACDSDTSGTNERLDGNGDPTDETYSVIAIISAGPDQTFNSSCAGGATPSITKSGDDIINEFTYASATAETGGLWNLKSGDPATAEITKNLEVDGSASFSGGIDLTGSSSALELGAASLLFPTEGTLINCNVANDGLIRINTSMTPDTLELCDSSTGWIQIGGGLWQEGTGDDIYYNIGTPQVGIGNNSPSEALDVTGNIAASGNVTANGNVSGADISASGNGSISGTLGVTGTSNLGTLNATGAVDFDTTLNVDGATTLVNTLDAQGTISDSTGDLTIGDNLVVTGTSDLQGDITNSTGDVTIDTDTEIIGSLDVEDASVSNDLTVDGTVSNPSGNLALTDNVDVTGAIDATGNIDGSDITASGDINAGNIINVNGDQLGPALNCSSTQKLEWNNGSGWSCVTDLQGGAGGGTPALDDITDVDAGSPADGECLVYNNTSGDWENAACSGVNAGIFEIVSNVARVKTTAGDYTNDDFVFGSPQLDDDTDTNHDSRFFFDKSQSAFRAGLQRGNGWNSGNIGQYSTAFGRDPIASGNYSFAVGETPNATGRTSVVMGAFNTASGDFSIALGRDLTASGEGSMSLVKDVDTTGDYSMGIGLGETAGTDPIVSGNNSFGIFMGDQSGVDITASNTMSIMGGTVAIGDIVATTGGMQNLELDVTGDIGADNYCDADGNNCTAAADLGGGLWTDLTGGRIHYGTSNANQVGVGTANPQTTLDVNGGLRVGSVSGGAAPTFMNLNDLGDVSAASPTDGDCITYNNGTGNWESGSCTSGSNLGIFEVVSNVVRMKSTSGDYTNDDFVFGSPQLDDDADANHDTRMFFDKSKGAFRAGTTNGTEWDDANIGDESVAFGLNNTASGTRSFVVGFNNTASGTYSIALGNNLNSTGQNSIAWGNYTNATGQYSTAGGATTVASGAGSFAIGEDAIASGDQSFAFGLGDATGTGVNRPTVSGDSSFGIFMGDQTGLDITDANTMSLMGGEFGIGTISPAEMLQVEGTALFRDCTYINRKDLTDQCGGSHYTFATKGLWENQILHTSGGDGNSSQVILAEGAQSVHRATFGFHPTTNIAFLEANAADLILIPNSGNNIGIGSNFHDGTDTVESMLHIQSGDLRLDGGEGNEAGCIRYNDTSDELEFSDDCSTFTAISDVGAASAVFEVTGGAGSEVVSSVDANAPYTTSDFVFGSPQLDDDTDANHDIRMYFDKSKAVFRAGSEGTVVPGRWNTANTGNFSAAFGEGTQASAPYSFASGYYSNATGDYGVAFGNQTQAGRSSMAVGAETEATGWYAFAAGRFADATANYSTAIGQEVIVSGANSVGFGLGASTGANPTVSGTSSFGIFMGDHSGVDITTDNTMAIMGGNVGIGTISPDSPLYVSGNSGNGTYAMTVDNLGSDGDIARFRNRTGNNVVTIDQSSSNNPSITMRTATLGGGNAYFEIMTNSGARYMRLSGSSLQFAPGDFGAYDTNLYRNGDDILRTNDSFIIDQNLSIGSTDTHTQLDIDGTLKIAYDSEACDTDREGAIHYDATTDEFKVCATAGSWSTLPLSSVSSLWTDNTTHITRADSHIINAGETMITAGFDGTTPIGMIYYSDQQALRLGVGSFGRWDEANIGNRSFATGAAEASGSHSVGMGQSINATGNFSFAVGDGSQSGGTYAVAMGGGGTTADGVGSFATGYNNTASGSRAIAMGNEATSSGDYSVALGLGDATGTAPIVSGTSSFGIFMGDQSGEDLNVANMMVLEGGSLMIGDGALDNSTFVNAEITIAETASSASLRWGPAHVNSNTMAGYLGYDGGSTTTRVNVDNGSLHIYADDTATSNAEIYLDGDTSFIGLGNGTTTPAAELDIGGTGAVILTRGTTAERPSTGVNGMIRYNSTTNKFEAYENSAWADIISSGSSLWTDNTTHITRGNIDLINAGETVTSAGLNGGKTGILYHNDKAAMRIGTAGGTQWDEANIGTYSFAHGEGAEAVGYNSAVIAGGYTTGGSTNAVAMQGGSATGSSAFAVGPSASAAGTQSKAFGQSASVSGDHSIMLNVSGSYHQMTQDNSVSIMGGNVGIGTVAPGDTLTLNAPDADLSQYTYGSTPQHVFYRANGTEASPSGVSDGDYIGLIDFYGHQSGTGYNNAAYMGAVADGNADVGQVPMALVFGVAYNFGAGKLAQEKLRIDKNGRFGFKDRDADAQYEFSLDGSTALPFFMISTDDDNDGDVLYIGSNSDASFGGTGGLRVHSGTTAQRPGSPDNGTMRYNSTTNKFEAYENSAWTDMIGGGSSLWTDNTTHITRGNIDLINAGETVTTAGLNGGKTGILYHNDKAAMRIGTAATTEWDEGNIGTYSFATGQSTTASGYNAIALGLGATATGNRSLAFGQGVTASNNNNIAMGRNVTASGNESMAIALGTATATHPSVTGANSFGIFLGDQSGVNLSDDDTVSIIGATGGVGIGTTTPASALDVNGSVTLSNPAGSSIDSTGNAAFIIRSNSQSNQLYLSPDGRVGIGVQPGQDLHVQDATTAALRLDGGVLSTWDIISSAASGADDLTVSRINGTGDFVFDTGYKVGIGTASPTGQLDVITESNTTDTILRIGSGVDNSNTSSAILQLRERNGGDYARGFNMLYNGAAGDHFAMQTLNSGGTTEIMRILRSNGYMGLGGTTNPQATLHLGGTGALTDGIAFGDGDSGLYESIDDALRINLAGTDRWIFEASRFYTNTGSGPSIASGAVTNTPNFLPRYNDTDTGIGRLNSTDDTLGMFTGGNPTFIIDASNNIGIGGDFTTDTIESQLHIAAGDIRIDGGIGNEAGCIRFDDTTDQLQYSDDCTTFSAFSAGGGTSVLNDLTDVYTDYTTEDNLIIGRTGAAALTTGARNNVFIGELSGATSGNSTATTDYNTSVGYLNLFALTSGNHNASFGYGALNGVTSGTGNTAIGSSAGTNVTTTSGTTAIGYNALREAGNNPGNTALGYSAGGGNGATTSITTSTLLGYNAGKAGTGDNLTVSASTLVGYDAGGGGNTGDKTLTNSVIIGASAGTPGTSQTLTTTDMVVIGNNALDGNTTVAQGVVIGFEAGDVLDGDNNTLIGYRAGNSITTGSDNIIIGHDIDTPTATTSNHLNIGNLVYGDMASDLLGIGDFSADTIESSIHVATGDIRIDGGAGNEAGCLRFNDTTDQIEFSDDCSNFLPINAAGAQEIDSLGDAKTEYTTDHNMFLGFQNGANVASGAVGNIGLGEDTLDALTTGDNNVAIGYQSLGTVTTAFGNVAIGRRTMNEFLDNGGANIAIGSNALRILDSGYDNTAVGDEAFEALDGDRSGNTGLGNNVGKVLAAGNNNTFLGSDAGEAITTGSRNIFIGDKAADGQTSGDDNILIGQNIELPSLTGSDQLNIGNLIYGDLSNQYLMLGDATSMTTLGNSSQKYQFYSSNATGDFAIGIANSTSAGTKADIALFRARGSVGSETTVQNGDELGAIRFTGYDGSSFENRAQITGIVDSAVSNNIIPTAMTFRTANDSSPTGTERMRITSSGDIGFGDFSSDTVDSNLHIASGDIRLDGGAGNEAGCLRFNDTSDQLEYSNDCSTYSTFGGGSAVFEVSSNVVRGISGTIAYATDDFVFGSSQLADTGDANHDNRMFFDKSKGAFRAGVVTGTEWDDSNVGAESVAFGRNAEAIGNNTFAAGTHVAAVGNESFAVGNSSYAQSYGTIAFGLGNSVSGSRSVSIGDSSNVSGTNSMAFGLGQDAGTTPIVSGDNSLGIFMGDQSGIDITDNNTMSIMGASGGVGIGTVSPNANGLHIDTGGVLIRGTDGANAARFLLDTSSGSTEMTLYNGAQNSMVKLDATGDTYFVGGNVGIGTNSPTYNLSFDGNSAQTIAMEAHTTSDTAGNDFTIQAGGATLGASNKDGGSLILSAGAATGNGESGIDFYAVVNNQGGGSTARAPEKLASIFANDTTGATVFQLDGKTTNNYFWSDTANGTLFTQGTTYPGQTVMFFANNNAVRIGGNTGTTATVLEVDGVASQTGDYFNITSDGGSAGDLLTMDSSGNLGIGTTTPQHQTEIYSSSGSAELAISLPTTNDSSQLFLYSERGDTSADMDSNSNAGWAIQVFGNSGFHGGRQGDMVFAVDTGAGGPSTKYLAAFDSTDRRVGLGYGVNNSWFPDGTLHVKASDVDEVAATFDPDDSGTPTADLTQWRDQSESVLSVVDVNGNFGILNASPSVALDVTGDIEYTGTITDVSDRRLKENITPLNTSGNLIDRITQIDTYSFTMKDDITGRPEFGVMAQEIEEIFPELVHTADDDMGTKSVNYVGLIAPMIEATKELKTENNTLKSEVLSLKTAQAQTNKSLTEISEQVAMLNKVTSASIGNKASMESYIMLLLGLIGGGMFMMLIQRRKPQNG
ncbi:MAG: tail fiber domain-containing protein [Alphaproteobacteria bacterium]